MARVNVHSSHQFSFLRFLASETAQDNVEYALVGALIALFAIVSVKGLSDKIANLYTALSSNITSNVPGAGGSTLNSVTSTVTSNI